jgi:hypothetical protein
MVERYRSYSAKMIEHLGALDTIVDLGDELLGFRIATEHQDIAFDSRGTIGALSMIPLSGRTERRAVGAICGKNTAGDAPNLWLSFSMLVLLSGRLPFTISETTLSVPSSGTRSRCRRPFCSIHSARASCGVAAGIG